MAAIPVIITTELAPGVIDIGRHGDFMDREVTLQIVLERPPSGVDFGLQKGRGSKYETVQTQRSDGKDLRFEFAVTVKPDGKSPYPDFGGPFVQGLSGGRFVYIDIGTSAGQADSCWSRRLKIPLTGLTPEMIAENVPLEARVPGTGRDGGPNCATVKPFAGWMVRR